MVQFEKIDDVEVFCFVCDIMKMIENEFDYLGYIKVIVIWEIWVVEYVKQSFMEKWLLQWVIFFVESLVIGLIE